MTLTLPGYDITECLHSTHHSEVFAGVRSRDGMAVALKVYRGIGEPERARRRAADEFALLERLDCAGVVRPVALERSGERAVLVVEHFTGIPLTKFVARGPLELGAFLVIAEQITTSVCGIHAARIVHKDLKPANVLIDPETLATCIIDFGIAAEFGRAQAEELGKPAEGTLQSMAPEQTGRIGLGIDFRTDLYSLGATLYHALTGVPPFETRDPLELIHAHVATIPRAPAERRPDVPDVLSRVILKLLEKDPERRYQTAWGLRADLVELRRHWEESGRLPKQFAIGARDASDRLRFPHSLFGREHESDALRAALERVSHSGAELVFLVGPPGIGKSALASVLRREVALAKGYLAQAKFDSDGRAQPYLAFAAALTGLIDQILAESSERLEQWALRLRAGLGTIGRALLPLAPNLEFVVRDFPPVPRLAPREAQERLALAIVRLVEVFTHDGRPLVLFLDDLQWADAGSRALLEALASSAPTRALLIVGTYRHAEMSGGALRGWLERMCAGPMRWHTLELGALRFDQVNAMLAEILSRDPIDTEWLTTCIGMKTQNNPLLIRRLLEHLWERGLIRYVHGAGWTWDPRELAEIEITDDAAHILAAKIQRLAAEPARALRIASVLGAVFDVELLSAVCGNERLELLQTLLVLTEEGLIVPCREGFRFVHDRVQDAARAPVAQSEQEQIHHRAATALQKAASGESPEARLFEIVDHLDRALGLMQASDRIPTLELNLKAGSRALTEGASAAAMQYLATARALMSESDWDQHAALMIPLHHASAEAAYQLGEFELALKLLDTMSARALDPFDRARIAAKRIEIFYVGRSTREAAELAIRMLREFGIALPAAPRALHLRWIQLYTEWCIRGRRILLMQPARDPSPARIGLLRVLAASGAPTSHRSSQMAFMAIAFMVRQYAKQGWLSPPAALLVAYGVLRVSVLRSPRGVDRYRTAGLDWIERVPDSPFNVHAKHLIRAWIDPWLAPRRSAIEPLAEVAEELRETGQLGHASSCLHVRACYLALIGEPLSLVRSEFRKLGAAVDRNMAQIFEREVPSLLVLTRDAGAHFDIEAALARLDTDLRNTPAIHVSEAVRWVGSLCVLGQWKRALVLAQHIEPYVRDVVAMSTHVADYELYRGLAAAAVTRRRMRLLPSRGKRVLRRSRRRLTRWCAYNPDFAHMRLGLDAERLRLRGRSEQAAALYERAAERAREQGYIHHAALLRERRAELFRSLHRTSAMELELQLALALYETWGADAKVDQLRRALRVG